MQNPNPACKRPEVAQHGLPMAAGWAAGLLKVLKKKNNSGRPSPCTFSGRYPSQADGTTFPWLEGGLQDRFCPARGHGSALGFEQGAAASGRGSPQQATDSLAARRLFSPARLIFHAQLARGKAGFSPSISMHQGLSHVRGSALLQLRPWGRSIAPTSRWEPAGPRRASAAGPALGERHVRWDTGVSSA